MVLTAFCLKRTNLQQILKDLKFK
uniref:Uncharacterized protein n=1 Tax=Rhizophora mucronata TaxID=61149 RepID=A0A2P2J0X5_RHIMU